MRASSQNVLFKGAPPVDQEFEHPPGCYIARALHKALAESDWEPSAFDNWRDCGWSIECTQGASSLQIAIARVEDDTWMLQVSPMRAPGLLGRLLKKEPSADPAQCLSLAKIVHDIMSSDALFSGFQWCWDGYPNDSNSTSEPVPHNDTG